MLTTDSDTIEVPFFTKSNEVFELTTQNILDLEKYRKAIDERIIHQTGSKHGPLNVRLFAESQRIMKFLKQYSGLL